jgi:hypothetical protein
MLMVCAPCRSRLIKQAYRRSFFNQHRLLHLWTKMSSHSGTSLGISLRRPHLRARRALRLISGLSDSTTVGCLPLYLSRVTPDHDSTRMLVVFFPRMTLITERVPLLLARMIKKLSLSSWIARYGTVSLLSSTRRSRCLHGLDMMREAVDQEEGSVEEIPGEKR